jgi:hypothetical protein
LRHLAAAAFGVAMPLVLIASRADAQIHWDASAQVGVMKRVLTDRQNGDPVAGFGPAGQLTGHVALLPLVRVGGYIGHDISPFVDGALSARDITWGGLRAKIMSPWPRGDVRLWLFVGFGYAGVYQRSTSLGPGTYMRGAGGSFFEVPFGLGASYKLRKPWELCAELGARAGFGHTGSVYGHGVPKVEDWPGTDSFAIGLTAGVLVDL